LLDAALAITDLECEQDEEPPQCHRAVNVEVDGQHAGGLSAQELPPTGVGVPHGCRWDPVTLEDPRIVEAPTRWPSLSNSPWILLYPQRAFSRTAKAARTLSIDGRPVGLG
jgi:hypothetical protein